MSKCIKNKQYLPVILSFVMVLGMTILPFSSYAQNSKKSKGKIQKIKKTKEVQEIKEAQIETEISRANPHWAGFFSLLLPGAGHYYQGRWGKGAFFTFSETSLLLSSVKTAENEMVSKNLFLLFQNEHFYNVYSSYQDARIARKNLGYYTPIAKDSAWDLFTATVDPEIWNRWTFLLPTALIGGLAGLVVLASEREEIPLSRLSWGIPLLGTQATAIGIGEESFFRGYLQPEFTQLYGGYEWPAIFTQAAIFGALHTSDEVKWRPFLIGAFGLYDGWVAKRNGYSLRENVAQHAWWDFSIFSMLFLVNGEAPPLIMNFPTVQFK